MVIIITLLFWDFMFTLDHLDDQVGAVVTTSSGRTLVSVGREVGLVDWETGTFERVLEIDMKEGTRFNDCKCDPAGRFWAGKGHSGNSDEISNGNS